MHQENVQAFLRELPRMREDLPYSPEVLGKLFVQTGGASLASLEQVGDTLSRDQGLTTRILSMANSAYYGLQAEVRSVSRAAAVLGMNEIRNIVLTLGINGLTKRYTIPKDFDLPGYWKHQFLVALIAREISHMIDVGKPDTLFTVGMLHDIGKLIIALRRPVDWQAIHDMLEDGEMTDAEAEDAYWGLDHAVVGALVLKSWDLPTDLVEPINWHHAPELSPDQSSESLLVALADTAAHTVENPEGIYALRMERLCTDLGADLDEIMETAGEFGESEDIEQFVSLLS